MLPDLKRSDLVLGGVALAFAVLIVALVAGSLSRPDVETFVPTRAELREVGTGSVGPRTFTVDARSPDGWVHFDLSRGAVVDPAGPGSLDWDIAFRRHRMITNGGATNVRGRAGVIDLGPTPIESAVELTDADWVVDERPGDESRNRALESWYDYSWISHILEPADRTFALRTADGRYGLLRFMGYYCPGGQAGCVTFTYRYRGDGLARFPAVTETVNGKW